VNHFSAAAVGLALSSLTACYSHRAATTALTPNQSVRVTYAPPQDVSVVHGGDAFPVMGVRELIGSVQRGSGDSLWLMFSSVRDAGGLTWKRPGGAVALVVRKPGTTVELRRLSQAKTTAAILSGIAGAFVLTGFIVLSTYDSGY